MDTFIKVLLPLITLVIGYSLNLFASSLESKRKERKRRIAEKEQAYAKISAKLHDVFETYRILTLEANMTRAPSPLGTTGEGNKIFYDRRKDIETIAAKYRELKTLVFEQSLYLKPEILQNLVDLSLADVRRRHGKRHEDAWEEIEFEEQHVDQLWSDAKAVMNDMRLELGLDPYPDTIMKMWR